MPRLARTALALVLATWTAAVAALPPCADDLAPGGCSAAAAADAGGDGQGDADRDCDVGCAFCACCQPPAAVPSTLAGLAPRVAEGRVAPSTWTLARERAAGEIFQPPRA